MKAAKLTKKQSLFVAEYQTDFNGTKAAIRAGYSCKAKNRASEIAYQLLQKAPVKEALQKSMEERLLMIGVQAERVLTELARVGFSDIRSLYNDDGSLKHPRDWDTDTASAVAGIEFMEEFEGHGKDRKYIGTTKKIRVFDKVRALEILGKHLGIFPTEKKDDDGGVKEVSMTNLELSAKIVYLVTLACEKQKELEDAQSKPQFCK